MNTCKMKRIFFVLSTLFVASGLVGCGGGSSGTVASSGNSPGSSTVGTGSGHTLTVLHTFGSTPSDNVSIAVMGSGLGDRGSSLLQASDGNFYGVDPGGANYGNGVVFKISPTGVESIVNSFGATANDCNDPVSLMQASDGNFYGTCTYGGPYRQGVVFKLTLTGVESVLYGFGGTVNDAFAPNSLIQGGDGNFYGVSSAGGAQQSGTFFKITAAGSETVLYSFGSSGKSDAVAPSSLMQASDGNFYGLAFSGGANNQGAVFKITPLGVESVLYSFGTNSNDGTLPIGRLIQASDGYLYGATTTGGANGTGAVFKLSTAGVETVLSSFFGTNSTNYISVPVSGPIQAGDGNFYGTGAGGVYEVSPSGTLSTIYQFDLNSEPNIGVSAGHLLQGSDGNFYGVASGLSQQNGFTQGVVFKLN